ncbi:branched-chain amino acid ABC transporter permease [Mesorhizobium koreense]|uniref:branched-chain amino acid ABC transporter permease n=1 Tax=Mesorhizobium koreense TaxID=3074855 RepID=UPI00287BAD4A|nr:branched-chain amino acid ABC transporter permease [Mesorhizobium sp. WR6]
MLTPTIIAQILWTSLATSSYYVLFSLAFSLVLKINGAFNFAQAAMMTAAFYAAYTLVGILHLPGWVGFLGAIAGSVVLAVLTELLGFRLLRRRRAEQLFVFIFTLILSEFVAFLAMLIFGSFPTTIFSSLVWPVTLVGPVAVSGWDVPALASTVAAVAAVFLLLRFTKIGQAMTAVSDNAELAELYGIRQARTFLAAMIAAALLVGLGMFLYGSRAQVQPNTAIDLMIFAIAATIMGGIGNLAGTVVMAVVLGIIQNGSVLFIPSQWQGFLLYAFLFAAIIFLPNGIRLPERYKMSRRISTDAVAIQHKPEA